MKRKDYLPALFTFSPTFFIAPPVALAASLVLSVAVPTTSFALSAALSMPSFVLFFMSPISLLLEIECKTAQNGLDPLPISNQWARNIFGHGDCVREARQ